MLKYRNKSFSNIITSASSDLEQFFQVSSQVVLSVQEAMFKSRCSTFCYIVYQAKYIHVHIDKDE